MKNVLFSLSYTFYFLYQLFNQGNRNNGRPKRQRQRLVNVPRGVRLINETNTTMPILQHFRLLQPSLCSDNSFDAKNFFNNKLTITRFLEAISMLLSPAGVLLITSTAASVCRLLIAQAILWSHSEWQIMMRCGIFILLLSCLPSLKTSKEDKQGEEEELEEYEYEVGGRRSEWLIWELRETLFLMWRSVVTNLEHFCGGCYYFISRPVRLIIRSRELVNGTPTIWNDY